MTNKIIPEIAVSDIAASVAFYHSLGFVTTDGGVVDEHGTQGESLALGDAELRLIRHDIVDTLKPGQALGNGVTLHCSVKDVDDFYNKVVNGPLRSSVVREIETKGYGLREFKMADPNGYLLTFNTQVEEAEGAAPGERAQTEPIARDATRPIGVVMKDDTQPIALASDLEPRRDIDQVQPGVDEAPVTTTGEPAQTSIDGSQVTGDYGTAVDTIPPARRDIDQVQPGEGMGEAAVVETTTPVRRDVDQVQPGETSALPAVETSPYDTHLLDTASRETRVLNTESTGNYTEGEIEPYAPTDQADTGRS